MSGPWSADRDRRPWETVDRRVLLGARGPIREVAVETVRLPDGRTIDDYYTIRLADYVLIFAATTDGGVAVFRHYKHGVGRVCLGFPGGAVEDGEAPLDAARRELLEELGWVADRWVGIGSFVTNANQHCNVAHLFRADGCRQQAEATAPDAESPDLLVLGEQELLHPEIVDQFGGASHVALLALATHPRLAR